MTEPNEPYPGWREFDGTETLAFDEWEMTDQQLRSFLQWTSEVCTREYDRLWDEINQTPAGADDQSAADQLYSRLGGLMPTDHQWMLCASVVRDGVTAFEVYFDKLSWALERWAGFTPRLPDKAFWDRDVVPYYRQHLDLDVSESPVREIRDLRNLLTHRRGELVSEDDRQRFGGSDPMAYAAHLDEQSVLQHLDGLGHRIRDVERRAGQVRRSI